VDALAVDLLPVTATEIASWAIALVAVAVVLVGAVVLLASRRRRAVSQPDRAGADAPEDGSNGRTDA